MGEVTRQLIGKGRISSIYTDGFYAYKTYPSDYKLSWIEDEVNIQNEISKKTDLPVINYELDRANKEIKMDMIKGITLADKMRHEGYKNGLKDLIEIQKRIHSFTNLNLPKASLVFKSRINDANLDESFKVKALKSLYSIEEKSALCHFDLHFENIMFEGEKLYIIDWVDAKLSNPILDITRSYIIMREFIPSIASKYLKLVKENFNVTIDEMNKILPFIAAIRLTETTNEKFKKSLVDMINGNLVLS